MKKLPDFWNIHPNSKIIICGCGTSINEIKHELGNYITIGINDIERGFNPTYLLVSDTSSRFGSERAKYVQHSNAKYIFTNKDWYIPKKFKKVVYKLGGRKCENLDNKHRLDYSNNSPYIATILAYKMGAKHIGLIGVDFTQNHFYAKDGEHVLVRDGKFNKTKDDFRILKEELAKRKVNLYNLSSYSQVDTVPKLEFKKFSKL